MASGNFGAFVGGALIGALAAVLLAPQRGEKTRNRIKERVQRMNQAVYLDEVALADMVEEQLQDDANATADKQ